MEIPWAAPRGRALDSNPPLNKHQFIALVRPDDGAPVDIGLLGVPDDRAVIQGGGRAGAVLGPASFREVLQRFGTPYNIERDADLSTLRIADFGDLMLNSESVEATHQGLSDAVATISATAALPILIGGGHDLTFGGVRGLCQNLNGPIGGIAIDAHFDVRETVDGLITSGTPFRNILDRIDAIEGKRFVEIGVNGWVNTKAHQDYLEEKGARIFTLLETRRKGVETVVDTALRIAGQGAERIFCSIDLDGIAQAFAPGVSAPSPAGLNPEEAAQAAYLFGLDPKVAYFDIMELNPNFDQDHRTARLAVALFLNFLAGVARRKNPQRRAVGFRGRRP